MFRVKRIVGSQKMRRAFFPVFFFSFSGNGFFSHRSPELFCIKEKTYLFVCFFDANTFSKYEGAMDLNHSHFSFEWCPRVISILDLGTSKKEERYLMQCVFADPLIGAVVIFKRNPLCSSFSRRFLEAFAWTRSLSIVPSL